MDTNNASTLLMIASTTTTDDLEKMSIEELKTLDTTINKVSKEIGKLIWRDETRVQLLNDVKKTIEKCGVSFNDPRETILEDIAEDPRFDINDIRVYFDILASADADWCPDEMTAEFSEYTDQKFYKKYYSYYQYIPISVDFGDVYRGDTIKWKPCCGPTFKATYYYVACAVTKKFDLEKMCPQEPVECFIMDHDETKNWIYDCTVTRLETGEFKIVEKGDDDDNSKEWTATLGDLIVRCYEKCPIF